MPGVWRHFGLCTQAGKGSHSYLRGSPVCGHDAHTHGFISYLVHVLHSHASQWAAGLRALSSQSRKHRRVVQDAVTLREEETAPALNLN